LGGDGGHRIGDKRRLGWRQPHTLLRHSSPIRSRIAGINGKPAYVKLKADKDGDSGLILTEHPVKLDMAAEH